ncbi:MAG TPA: MBL fold metallo-hydrolase [Candidatus Dormibacteraeota bacterium]|nr:MBL fold metallo-hydrolase [Candidatus Dormibacteraeota bacterium]
MTATTPLLRFLGAAGTVTGSRFLVDTGSARVLVDCGLFQGLKELRLRNWQAFPVPPESIDAVVVTHAHLDHSGYLPALARDGFGGPVFATTDTVAMSRIVLPDSGRVQEEDAAYAARAGYSKHAPPLPLYTEADAQRVLHQFRATEFAVPLEVAAGVRATFQPAGHILGSAHVTLSIDGTAPRTIVFSGDLGRPQHPLLRPPAPPPVADVMVVESTYGDRRHEDEASMQAFAAALRRTAERGGVAIIPSFAVDRTEVVLFHIRSLIGEGRVPQLPVYVDSPMALAALSVYREAIAAGRPDVEIEVHGGDPFDTGDLHEARTPAQSRAINDVRGPAVIISASGMATGGRVLHHLLQRLDNPRNTVVLVGFQAAGTRGRSLLEGATSLKLLGRYVPVRAEIVNVPAFSVHADRDEIVAWLRAAPRAPETAFVVHGEPAAATSLAAAIGSQLGWTAVAPRHLEQVRVD